MECKIGEIFEFSGEWYQRVESDNCGKCSLFTTECGIGTKSNLADKIFGQCSIVRRSDNKYVIFKKLEKVGKPYNFGGKLMMQPYKLYVSPVVSHELGYFVIYSNRTIDIEIKPTKEDMGDNTNIRPYDELFSPGTVSNTKHLAKEDMEEKEPTYEELLHYYHSTVGLWAIDRNPQEVDFDWICKNAFQLGMDKTLPNCERIGKDLKPFNLEAARSGKPVCTRDGRKARIICFDTINEINYPIIALIEGFGYETLCYYNEGGKAHLGNTFDLMMLPEKKEGWTVIFKDNLLRTEKEARELAERFISEVIRIEKIEWEE